MTMQYQESDLEHAETAINSVWPPKSWRGAEIEVPEQWRRQLQAALAAEIRAAIIKARRRFILGLRRAPKVHLRRKK